MEIQIREAAPHETERLSEIAQQAKRSWDYPEEYFEIWKDELTITTEYILKNKVFVAEISRQVVGFYSLITIPANCIFGVVPVEKGYWMDHIFVDPNFQFMGIGTQLFQHATTYCRENSMDHLKVFVDPNAIGFYKKMGAQWVRNSPSSIADREIPVFVFHIELID
jgi:maltose O-acetyltransferase